MFQRAFGFVPLAQGLEALAPQSARLAQPGATPAPSPQRPFPNFAPWGTIHEQFAPLHTASHTLPQASSTKNLGPSHSTGCASRSVRPCNDAELAEPQTTAPRRNTP